MTLTPRQIAAYLEFSDKLERSERESNLVIAAIAAQGDSKQIEQARKDLKWPLSSRSPSTSRSGSR